MHGSIDLSSLAASVGNRAPPHGARLASEAPASVSGASNGHGRAFLPLRVTTTGADPKRAGSRAAVLGEKKSRHAFRLRVRRKAAARSAILASEASNQELREQLQKAG